MPLTEQQIKRQDVIDSAIDEIIAEVKPDYVHGEDSFWQIRDALVTAVSNVMGISEKEIYPYEEI